MSKRKTRRKPLEFEVKLYFQMLTNEAQGINQELLALPQPARHNLVDAIRKLANHYGDVCYPAARGPQARLNNLENISLALDSTLADFKKVRAALGNLEKSARKLRRKVTSKKTKELAEKLWYD